MVFAAIDACDEEECTSDMWLLRALRGLPERMQLPGGGPKATAAWRADGKQVAVGASTQVLYVVALRSSPSKRN